MMNNNSNNKSQVGNGNTDEQQKWELKNSEDKFFVNSDDINVSDDTNAHDDINVSNDTNVSDDTSVSDDINVSNDTNVSDDTNTSDNTRISEDVNASTAPLDESAVNEAANTDTSADDSASETDPSRTTQSSESTSSETSDKKSNEKKISNKKKKKKNSSSISKKLRNSAEKTAEKTLDSGKKTLNDISKNYKPTNFLFGKRNLVDAFATLLFLHTGILLALELLWKFLPYSFLNYTKDGFTAFIVSTGIINLCSLVVPLLICIKLYRVSSSTLLGRKKISNNLIFSSLLLGVPASIFFNSINNIFTFIIISLDFPMPSVIFQSWYRSSSVPSLFLLFVATAFVPAILEELFFRGFMQKSLYGFKDKKIAIYLSAFAFALYHNDPLFFVGPFAAGILLARLRQDSESVLPTILMHMSMNTAIIFFDPLLPRFNAQMFLLDPAGTTSNLGANVMAMVASGIVIFFIYRFIQQNVLSHRPYSELHSKILSGLNKNTTETLNNMSTDANYIAVTPSIANYIRLIVAAIIWLISRILINSI